MNSVRSFSCKFGGDGCSQHRDTVRGDHLRERVSEQWVNEDEPGLLCQIAVCSIL